MKRKLRRSGSKRKYKRLVAAVAGAAVLSSTMLPGLPIEKAHAASNPQAALTAEAAVPDTAEAPAADTARESGRDRERDNNRDTGREENRDRDRDRGQDQDRDYNRVSDPVQVVRNNAASFGFNASRDNFSLISKSENKATVRVRTSDQTFKVDLVRRGNSWQITAVRGIGDMTHPATYTSAKRFYYQPTYIAPPYLANPETLYESSKFNEWHWYEGTYPDDMSFGIILQDPRQDNQPDVLPAGILAQLKNIDFSRQFVLYAHLGTVAPNGYSIAIQKVVREGDTIMVTVRTKSPLANETPTISLIDTYLTFDRSILNYTNPTKIVITDQNGRVLTSYTLTRS
jgi:hypothetical protein